MFENFKFDEKIEGPRNASTVYLVNKDLEDGKNVFYELTGTPTNAYLNEKDYLFAFTIGITADEQTNEILEATISPTILDKGGTRDIECVDFEWNSQELLNLYYKNDQEKLEQAINRDNGVLLFTDIESEKIKELVDEKRVKDENYTFREIIIENVKNGEQGCAYTLRNLKDNKELTIVKTTDKEQAIKEAMRRDPDLIFVDDNLKNDNVSKMVYRAANCGHLVVSKIPNEDYIKEWNFTNKEYIKEMLIGVSNGEYFHDRYDVFESKNKVNERTK